MTISSTLLDHLQFSLEPIRVFGSLLEASERQDLALVLQSLCNDVTAKMEATASAVEATCGPLTVHGEFHLSVVRSDAGACEWICPAPHACGRVL